VTTIRELVVSIGTQLDGNSLKGTERKLSGAAANLQRLIQRALEGGFIIGLAKGAIAMTKMASRVEETMNVINVSFEDNAQQVLDWSRQFASATGRSQYELQKTASDLGALLRPMLGSADAAAGMSTSLAELSVDLASFFNVADRDVLVALRAGIVGETEPMRRLGVNMLQTNLQAFALSQGIRKSWKSMTEAERVTLRYQYLMEQTALIQGDAARTATSYENSSKALSAALTDLGTGIGLKILPFMTKLTRAGAWVVRTFENVVAKSRIAEAGMATLGVVAAALAIKLAIAFAPVLLPFLKLAAIVAAAALVIDEFLVFLDGGDSLIGRFIDSIWGPGSAGEAAQKLKQAWADLKTFFVASVIPALKNLAGKMVEFVQLVKPLFGAWFDFVVEFWKDIFSKLSMLFDLFLTDGVPAIESFAGAIKNTLAPVFETVSGWLDKIQPKLKWLIDNAQKLGGKALRAIGLDGLAADLGLGLRELPAGGVDAAFDGNVPTLPVSQFGGAGNTDVNQTINQSVNVDVVGNATPETANRIAQAAVSGVRDTNRKTIAALHQKARAAS
jgi:hypothetical protein